MIRNKVFIYLFILFTDRSRNIYFKPSRHRYNKTVYLGIDLTRVNLCSRRLDVYIFFKQFLWTERASEKGVIELPFLFIYFFF